MDFENIGISFDSWGDLIEKARKAKGLENWNKLQGVADKLVGKTARDITFTSSHPSYEGKPVKHTLGSVIGNLHFLLGYANPAFHVAPYHWQIVDPYITDEDAASREHPSRPDLWEQSGLPMEDEGDLESGKPYAGVTETKRERDAIQSIKDESIPVTSGYGYYICIPSQGIVFSARNGHIYKWDIVKDSFFAASNPEVAEVMNAAAQPDYGTEEIDESVEKSVPVEMLSVSEPGDFHESVYSFVKSKFPIPGSIIKMNKSLFAVVTSNSLKFYNEESAEVSVSVFDRVYKSFDLTTDGDIHPSILLNFAEKYLKISKSDIDNFISENEDSIIKSNLVYGKPTDGYDDIPSIYTEYERNIVINGNSFTAVPRL